MGNSLQEQLTGDRDDLQRVRRSAFAIGAPHGRAAAGVGLLALLAADSSALAESAQRTQSLARHHLIRINLISLEISLHETLAPHVA
jgi:hypothetical protein